MPWIWRGSGQSQLAQKRKWRTFRGPPAKFPSPRAEIDEGADRFVDAVVAWGTEDQIAARIQQHYDAGATHVCIQAVSPDGQTGRPDWNLLEALAPAG